MSQLGGPQCILCRRVCSPDMNYCLPQCEGRKTGLCHFFCQACWNGTLCRVQCELAACTGCAIGANPYPMNGAYIGTTQESEVDSDLEMQD